ncbi:MAG TPA: nucleoside hydrolase [Anaerolineales bacterium]|nr:nucleoside hydrolase [Anaerolineales bacterium]
MSKRILIDTDPGIDDSLAILLALASSEVQIEGITTIHGNCSVDQATVNALAILELAGAKEIPVAKGFSLPLVQPSLLAAETHGEAGLGYAKLPGLRGKPQARHASDFLIEKIMSNPGEITLLAIGPLTNIAFALRQEPRIVKAVKEVISMGGSIRYPGNASPLAEYNVFVDPHAAHIVYHSGMPITLVPLDVTYQCILTPEDVKRLQTNPGPISSFIDDSTRFYMEFHDEYQKIAGCAINDPLALALTFDPDLCDYQELYVDVDISGGVSMGKTFADFHRLTKEPANMKVAIGVRPRDFMELFLQRMESLAGSALQSHGDAPQATTAGP